MAQDTMIQNTLAQNTTTQTPCHDRRELRSRRMQSFLTKPLPWILRWGATVLFLFVVSIALYIWHRGGMRFLETFI